MNSSRCSPSGHGVTFVLLTAVVLPSVSLAGNPVRTVESAPAPARDHHLWVGVELFYPHDRDLCPVRRFDGFDSVLRLESGADVLARRANGFKWKPTPKISAIAVHLEEVKPERTYSSAADPALGWMSRQMALTAYHDDMASNADRALARAHTAAAIADRQALTPGAPAPGQSGSEILRQASLAHTQVHASIEPLNDLAFYSAKIADDDEDTTACDALRIRFTASAPQPIADANVLAMVRIRTKSEGYRDVSFQRPIGPLGPTPREFAIDQIGLPPGYEFVSAQLHVFNHGQEIATNLSERHLPLTAAEAREYLLLDHFAQNSGATIAARPAWSLAPDSLRSAADPAAFDFNVEVDVDPAGQITALRPAANQILPDTIRETVEQLPFLPALDAGEPVASTLTIRLADYFR